jgi:hypothetical protein
VARTDPGIVGPAIFNGQFNQKPGTISPFNGKMGAFDLIFFHFPAL